MTYQAPAYPYPPPHYRPQPKNGLGTTALVLGILAFLASFIPLLSLFTAIPLAIAGFIFAMAGYARISSGKANNKGATTVGLIGSIVAVIISISLTMMVGAWLGSPSSSTTATAPTADPGRWTAVAEDDENEDQDEDTAKQEEEQAESLFSGQERSDVVGEAGETLQARGVTVTAESLALEPVSYSDPVLCSYVEYENNSDSRLDYNEWDWSLQSPSGDIKSITWSGPDDDLSSGDLAPEGTTSGYVCFENPAETGEHVLLFEGFITADSSRGAWINDIE